MAYSDKVVDHYENPRNVGSFDKGDDSVGTCFKIRIRKFESKMSYHIFVKFIFY